MPRFYTPNEIRDHCFEDDAYVIIHAKVVNLTPLLQLHTKQRGGGGGDGGNAETKGFTEPVVLHDDVDEANRLRDEYDSLVQPLMRIAGKDISHWFDVATGDLKTCIDAETGLEVYATPYTGRFLHVPTVRPDSKIDWSYCNPRGADAKGMDGGAAFGETEDGGIDGASQRQKWTVESILTAPLPWWKDPQYAIGQLTSKTRRIKIINTLTHNETLMEVCAEEKLKDIIDNRFVLVNAHAWSYTWKRHTDTESWELDPEKTLEENGIRDESDEFEQLGLNADYYIPSIHIYFNDDLTVA